MYTKNDPIRKLIEKNGVLIAAHRGTCGGNVVQNTSLLIYKCRVSVPNSQLGLNPLIV